MFSLLFNSISRVRRRDEVLPSEVFFVYNFLFLFLYFFIFWNTIWFPAKFSCSFPCCNLHYIMTLLYGNEIMIYYLNIWHICCLKRFIICLSIYLPICLFPYAKICCWIGSVLLTPRNGAVKRCKQDFVNGVIDLLCWWFYFSNVRNGIWIEDEGARVCTVLGIQQPWGAL